MSRGHTSADFVLPGEYRKPAERLFPENGYTKGQNPDLKSTTAFAKALGIDADYQRLLALDKDNEEMLAFLEHFQNNLDLLIQKTWVEKSEEKSKEHLQDEIPVFMELIKNGDYLKAINEFASILEELAFLFFGIQSGKSDFAEYTFRIDVQMGLFWWYGARLYMFEVLGDRINRDDKILWAVLLLGLCYLTNF